MAAFNLLYISVLLTTAVSLYVFIVSPKGTFKCFFQVTPQFKDKKIWLFSIFSLIASKLIFVFFLEESPSSDTGDIDKLMSLGAIWIIGIILVGSLIIPFVEEVIFRGYVLLPFLDSQHKIAPIVGLVFSSVLFAFAHGSGVTEKVFSGLIYANFRIRQRSLLGSLILHSISNFLLLAVMALLISVDIE